MPSHDKLALVEYVGVSYHDPHYREPLLEHIDFSLAAGEALALTGPSGSGKTTALCLAMGASQVNRGEVLVLGRSPGSLTSSELTQLRSRIGYVAQHGALLGNLSLLDNLALPLRYHRHTSEVETAALMGKACALLDLDLDDVPRVQPALASAEMRHLVALAKALVLEPAVLLIDEPAYGLGGNAAREYWRLLAQLRARQPMAVILCSLDATSGRAAADRAIALPPRVDHVREGR
jgi:ABC-type transporter Mla maintaining outer membrane lipid asymmetry ATPase subunit MlaF